jgi:catechol 2,3-dioxygenase-like lactoylglutathione lyase family enzyme
MPIARFSLVALDCPDPRALAEFYRQIIGGNIVAQTASDEWIRLETRLGSDLGFQLYPDHRPPDWPDGTPQQVHLDFDVDDLDEGERSVLAIGAGKADTQPRPDRWRVFLDPAGHPFCLVLP